MRAHRKRAGLTNELLRNPSERRARNRKRRTRKTRTSVRRGGGTARGSRGSRAPVLAPPLEKRRGMPTARDVVGGRSVSLSRSARARAHFSQISVQVHGSDIRARKPIPVWSEFTIGNHYSHRLSRSPRAGYASRRAIFSLLTSKRTVYPSAIEIRERTDSIGERLSFEQISSSRRVAFVIRFVNRTYTVFSNKCKIVVFAQTFFFFTVVNLHVTYTF